MFEPKVFVIGETALRFAELWSFLEYNGTPDWFSDAASDGEYLIEFAGRGCYQAFDTEKNPNITRIRQGNGVYIANLINQKHGSVLEHVHVNFVLVASRVVTHELARHRHANISQESGRFVRTEGPFDIYTPPVIGENPAALAIWNQALDGLMDARDKLVALFGLDREGVNFAYKKALTSAIRRIAPEGRGSFLTWTANLRDLRYIIEARTAPEAEIEMRVLFNLVAERVSTLYPTVFADFVRQPDPEGGPSIWVANNHKV